MARSMSKWAIGHLGRSTRAYSTAVSPFAPRHFLSIADLSSAELTALVRNAASHKAAIKAGKTPEAIENTLAAQTIALTFNKLSTRTRVSTEAAVARMGGHSMFLGKNDIQLGVNESLIDHSKVISSMVAAIVARVGPHHEITELAKHSSVPVLNALSELSHPLQVVADVLTIFEAFPTKQSSPILLGLEGLKLTWIGDANNVCCDLSTAAQLLGLHMTVCTPKGYGLTPKMQRLISDSAKKTTTSPGSLKQMTVPEESFQDADIIVTDTWVSMGQEDETADRMKAFAGFQVTEELARRGGAKQGWRLMHCLPRHPYEVSDDVFYGPRSLVFQESENRVYAATSALEAFVVNKGQIC